MSVFLKTPKIGPTLVGREGTTSRIEPRAHITCTGYGVPTGAGGRIAKNRGSAVLTGGKVAIRGEFGSLIKAELTFEAYNMDALNALDTAMKVNNKITISYGYNNNSTDPGAGGGGSGTYANMTVYDFNYKWSPVGPSNFNATATVKLVGSGQFISGVNVAGAIDGTGREFNASYRGKNDVVKVSSIWDVFDFDLQSESNQMDATGFEPDHGWMNGAGTLCSFEAPDGYVPPDPSIIAMSIPILDKVKPRLSYCSLGYIVDTLINQEILNNPLSGVQAGMEGMSYAFHPDSCLGPKDMGFMFSADPMSILFPGGPSSMKYTGQAADPDNGVNFYEGAATGLPACINGRSPAELKNILVSRDFLGKVQESMEESTKEGDDDASVLSIEKFLRKIFKKIQQCSGGAFNLGTQLDPAFDSTGKFVFLVNLASAPTTVTPHPFNIYSDWNVLDVSLTSKITKDQAAAAFAGGAGGSAGTGKDDEAAAEATSEGGTDKKPAPVTPQDVMEKTMPEDGFSGDSQKTAIGILKGLINEGTAAVRLAKKIEVYPLDLSLKLRGIHGFEFGDAISCNFVPNRYDNLGEGVKLAFTVLEVEQNISDGAWTTNVKTIARLYKG